jgi:hypothetical protein
MPSATARGRGKPSDLNGVFSSAQRTIAIDGRKTVNRFWRHNDLIEVKDGRYGIDSGSLAIFAAMEGAEHMSNGSREPAVPPAKTERATAAAMTGCFAIFAAIRRA